jgi:hypothetical protein
LTALRTPLPQATLGTYMETIKSMPTPYELISTSQNLVEHQLTLTQANQVIWYSLKPKNVNDFMSFIQDSRRYRKGVPSANLGLYRRSQSSTCDNFKYSGFGPKPELSDAWVVRGDIDIEEILRVLLKSVGPIHMKIAEANASMEITQIPLIIKNIMENSFFVMLNT